MISTNLIYKNINAFVLAGGKSIRMGRDKAFLRINGRLFIDLIIEELSILFKNIYVVGKHYHHPSLKDSTLDIVKNTGPIGGILTALTMTDSEINFFTGLDYPFIDWKVIKAFIEISKDDNFTYQAYVPKLDDGIHPLFAIYKRDILDSVKECISKREYRVRCIYQSVKTNYINILIKVPQYSDNLNDRNVKKCFYNLNSLEDYKRIFESKKTLNF